jgi:hypothetical protein
MAALRKALARGISRAQILCLLSFEVDYILSFGAFIGGWLCAVLTALGKLAAKPVTFFNMGRKRFFEQHPRGTA